MLQVSQCPRAEGLRELLLGREVLAVAVAAGDVGPLVDDRFPEELRAVLSDSSPVSSYCRAAPTNLGIWVLACRPSSRSSRFDRRADDGHVVEPQGELEVLLVAGPRVEVGQGLVDAAVLDVEHLLDLGVARTSPLRAGPVAQVLGPLPGPAGCRSIRTCPAGRP